MARASYYNYLSAYWRKIESGDEVVSEKVRKIMVQLMDLQNGKNKKYHFDPILANRPIIFIQNYCKQYKGKIGAPLKLDLFQKAIINAVYGFVDKNGNRKYQEVFIVEGRKNGKSTWISGLSLYQLTSDHEGGPEIDCVSTKKDAAKIIYNSAKNMVKQSPLLRKHIKSLTSGMYCDYNFGTFKALSSDSNTMDGLEPSTVVLDECHAITDSNLYDVMKQSLTSESRKQPLFFIITTSGFVREGIYDELYEYSENLLNGLIEDEHFLPFIYELDSIEEWDKEECWKKANPGLGTIKSLSKLRDAVAKAKATPRYRATVLTKDFNLKNIAAESWLSWEQIDNPETFDMELVRNTYGIGGCDLSAVGDLTCASLLIRRRNDEKLYMLQHYFIPEVKMEEMEETNSREAPYKKWEERGLLTVCHGNMVQYSDVTAWFRKMKDEYQIDLWRCGYDRAMANYWVEDMAYKFGQSVMEAVPQGAKTWTAPMKEMGAMLAAHRINYNDNPIFKWCLMNTAIKTQGTLDSIEPIKIQKRRRIDGTVSALNAYTIYVKYKNDYLNMVG